MYGRPQGRGLRIYFVACVLECRRARLLATLKAVFRTRLLTDVPEPCDLRQLIAEITVSLQSNERREHDRPSSCSGFAASFLSHFAARLT